MLKIILLLIFVLSPKLSFSQYEDAPVEEYQYDGNNDYQYDNADAPAGEYQYNENNDYQYNENDDYQYYDEDAGFNDQEFDPGYNQIDVIPEGVQEGIPTTIIEITNYLTNTIYTSNTTYVTIPSIETISPNVCLAILKSNLEELKTFISQDPNIVSQTRGDGNNLLHIAATRPNIEIIQYLLDQGISIDATNNAGRTALHIAAQLNNLPVADTLVRANAQVRIKDNFGYSALWMANTKGFPRMLQLLVRAQQQQPVSFETPNNNLNAKLKGTGPPNIFNIYTRFSEKTIQQGPILDTPWHKALFTLDYKEVEDLILLGLDPNTKDNKGLSPIHIAALYNNVLALEYLLALPSINLKTVDNFGSTPLHTAAGKATPEILKVLMTAGFDINQKNKSGWTPLFEATLLGNRDVVRYLLELGIAPNTRNNMARTPLHEAARLGYTYILRDLLDAGATYDVEDYQGKTPFFLAAESGHIDIISQLNEKGASPNGVNLQQQTPLHVAVLNNNGTLVKYLVDNFPVDIGQVDSLGRTALDLAYIKGNESIIAYLANTYVQQQTGTVIQTNSTIPLQTPLTEAVITEEGTENSADIEELEYPEGEYANEEIIDDLVADEEYNDGEYANEEIVDDLVADEEYNDGEYANEEIVDGLIADEEYANGEYADEEITTTE